MATKKKVTNEASGTPEVVDTVTVEAAADNAPAEVTPEPESTKVEESVENAPEPAKNGSLADAQAILGVPVTGSMNHATKMALRARQRGAGLPPTGQLDTRTRRLMHL